MTDSTDQLGAPWETVQQIIASADAQGLESFLERIGPANTARAISRIAPEDRTRLLTLLDPDAAADVIEEVPEAQAVDLIEALDPKEAAPILDEMASDRQADLLGDLDRPEAEAILQNMAPEEAADARQLMAYEPETTGGIMITEYLAYAQQQRVSDVLLDLQANQEAYADYNVQYVYVTDDQGRLKGVLRLRDLLFTPRQAALEDVMITGALQVNTADSLDELNEFFEQHELQGAPVVEADGRLVGVVQHDDVQAASTRRADRQFLGVSGIVGGEEFRSMPLLLRSRRRLSWLSINIVLNIVAASVIAVYQDTLAAAITLAVFLPMISDMSGCSGNQAVAVSMRELALGLVRPQELARVFFKEIGLGVINGAALGLCLGAVAILWQGNAYLGLVVGTALAANTIVAVSIGGLLPLVLKRLRLDPALVSAPILTTVTDICGFFLVFSIATLVLPLLTG